MNKLLKTTNKDYILQGDTDSCYLDINDLVLKLFPNGASNDKIVATLDKIGQDIQKGPIQQSVDYIFDLCNCNEKLMSMKREAIGSKILITSKKHYAMMIHNSEGVDYKPYKLKIMGLDIVKSSTPQKVRKVLKESLPIIFEQGEEATQKYIKQCKEDFMRWQPEEIAFPRSASDIDKWQDSKTIYKNRTPIHVRGALLHNKYITDAEPLQNGDKVKFIYLKTPNPIKEDCIAFAAAGKFPVTLDLRRYVDYELQFEKTFSKPMQGLLDPIGWHMEPQSSLEDFFG